MKRNRFVVLFAVLVLVLASLACNALAGGGDNDVNVDNSGSDSNDNNGFSFTTANIQNAHMARDIDDIDHTNVFAPGDNAFFCFFDLENAPDSTVVKSVWTLVEADGYESNSEIDSTEFTTGSDALYFSLERSADAWPVGQYKIDLYIDGSLVQTLNFEVQ